MSESFIYYFFYPTELVRTMAVMYIRKSPSEVRYYFDLSINEVTLILHQVLHELDVTPDKRFLNFTIEQVRDYYSSLEYRKFTLIILIANRIMTLEEIVGEIKKMPKPIRNKHRR